jgi:hypothetical protein
MRVLACLPVHAYLRVGGCVHVCTTGLHRWVSVQHVTHALSNRNARWGLQLAEQDAGGSESSSEGRSIASAPD